MHGRQLVICVPHNERIVGDHQLNPDQKRLQPRHGEKEAARNQIENPDPLVVHCGDPTPQIALLHPFQKSFVVPSGQNSPEEQNQMSMMIRVAKELPPSIYCIGLFQAFQING